MACVGRTRVDKNWPVTLKYFTSVPVLTVVPRRGPLLTSASKQTQIPTIHLTWLRNVPEPVWEAVDSGEE